MAIGRNRVGWGPMGRFRSAAFSREWPGRCGGACAGVPVPPVVLDVVVVDCFAAAVVVVGERWSWSMPFGATVVVVVVVHLSRLSCASGPAGAVVEGGAPELPDAWKRGRLGACRARGGPAGGVRAASCRRRGRRSTESSSALHPQGPRADAEQVRAGRELDLVGDRVDVVEEDLVPLSARLVRRPRGLRRRVPVRRARGHGLRVGHRL